MATLNVVGGGDGEILRAPGVQIRIMEDGSRTEGRLGAAEITLAAGVSGPPPHLHRKHEETFLVTQGTVRFLVEGQPHDAPAGTYVVVPIGVPHTFANASGAPAAFFNTFSPSFYIQYFHEIAALPRGPSGPAPADVLAVMARYATEPAGPPAA